MAIKAGLVLTVMLHGCWCDESCTHAATPVSACMVSILRCTAASDCLSVTDLIALTWLHWTNPMWATGPQYRLTTGGQHHR